MYIFNLNILSVGEDIFYDFQFKFNIICGNLNVLISFGNRLVLLFEIN